MFINKIIFIIVSCFAASTQTQTVKVIIFDISLEKSDILGGKEFKAFEGSFQSSVSSFTTEIDEITYDDGTLVDTKDIEYVSIGESECKFMPTNLKRRFPDMKALQFEFNSLKHLDQHDMKQFGLDLKIAIFFFNELTALEGDLFKFNSNLKHIDFAMNPLKYIDPKLFENFKQMSSLEEVAFRRIFIAEESCLTTSFYKVKSDIQTFQWNSEKCNDTDAERSYRNTITEKIKLSG